MAFYQYNEVTRELVQISDLEIAPDTNLPVSYIEISKADLLSFIHGIHQFPDLQIK